LIAGDPDYLEYQAGSDEQTEERYKVLGATKAGRVLIGVWTPREGKIRAVTAYDVGSVYRDLYWGTRK
jgi:uncharacterized DUF497 family protein